jgi:hypothetical protein
MAYKTLGAQRAELRTRLGFAAAGAAAGVQATHLNSILQNAQTVLYWAHNWARLRRYEDKSVGVDQYLIDYPATANPDRITAISILKGNVWSEPLEKGINPARYTTQSMKSWPTRWEPYEQIELWPISNAAYTARIFFIKNLDRFTEDNDHSTIDDTLIFTIALGDAKAHYRQPDAPVFMKRAENLLLTLKAKSWGKSKFSPYEYLEEPLVKPVAV